MANTITIYICTLLPVPEAPSSMLVTREYQRCQRSPYCLNWLKVPVFFLFQPHDSTIDVNWQSNWSDSKGLIAKSTRHRLLRSWWRDWEFSSPIQNLVLFWGGVSNDLQLAFRVVVPHYKSCDFLTGCVKHLQRQPTMFLSY